MIHDRLMDAYNEFDRHCRTNNIDYSIDGDYYNVQSYRLLGTNDVVGVLRHMANYVKDKQVDLEYDGFPVDYTKLKSSNFNVSTYNPLFKFTLKPIQEDNMPLNEDQMKGPTNAHGRKQAAFPASFRKLKTRDTYEGGGKGGKKKKKKDENISDSLDRTLPFEERLISSIDESVGLSMVDPEVLFIRNPAEQQEDEEEALQDALQTESALLTKYLTILENSENERTTAIVEGLIDRSTKQINELNELLGNEDGPA